MPTGTASGCLYRETKGWVSGRSPGLYFTCSSYIRSASSQGDRPDPLLLSISPTFMSLAINPTRVIHEVVPGVTLFVFAVTGPVGCSITVPATATGRAKRAYLFLRCFGAKHYVTSCHTFNTSYGYTVIPVYITSTKYFLRCWEFTARFVCPRMPSDDRENTVPRCIMRISHPEI
jgi:hypothetical protein